MTTVTEEKETVLPTSLTITETEKGLSIKAENHSHNAQLVYMLNTAAVRIMEDMFNEENESKED